MKNKKIKKKNLRNAHFLHILIAQEDQEEYDHLEIEMKRKDTHMFYTHTFTHLVDNFSLNDHLVCVFVKI